MKVSKSQLKVLIKECLVEILAEGLGAEAINEAVASPTPRRRAPSNAKPRPKTTPRKKPTENVRAAINEVAGNDNIMASILEDTVNSGHLQSVISAGDGTSAATSQAGVEQIEGNPEDFFGEENAGEGGRWASLAFNAQSKTSMMPPPPAPPQGPSNLDTPISELNKHG